MKKLLSSVSSTIGSSLFCMNSALAAGNLPDPGPINGLETQAGDAGSVTAIIMKIITYILDLVLIIGILYVIIAVISAPAAGEEGGEKVRKSILYVVVGIIVIVFARVVVNFADNVFRQ